MGKLKNMFLSGDEQNLNKGEEDYDLAFLDFVYESKLDSTDELFEFIRNFEKSETI